MYRNPLAPYIDSFQRHVLGIRYLPAEEAAILEI
jgi:hypothetical protein